MDETDYSKREIDSFFTEIRHSLDQILLQTMRTNGRVTRLEKGMLIVGTALIVVTALKFPELLTILKVL